MALMQGSQYRLDEKTIAWRGKEIRFIERGDVVTLTSDPSAKCIDILWFGMALQMFCQDLLDRGVPTKPVRFQPATARIAAGGSGAAPSVRPMALL